LQPFAQPPRVFLPATSANHVRSAQWSCLGLAGRCEPDQDVSGLERVMDGIDQVTLHHVKVNRPAQPRSERSYDRRPPRPARPAATSRSCSPGARPSADQTG
jgi:hypothetical protein